MQLTGLETILLASGIAAGSSLVTSIFNRSTTSKIAVSKNDCESKSSAIEANILRIEMARKEAWINHHEYCPEKRDLITKDEHEHECNRNLMPIRNDLKEVKDLLKLINERLIKESTLK